MSFDLDTRNRALKVLAAFDKRGMVYTRPESRAVNLHCHSFYSFNAFGWSPSALAWLARRLNLRVAGIVDFDVLDGVDEFLGACDELDVRGTAGIEARVYVPEFADRVINSLGEPGVCYHLGVGFASGQVPAAVAPILDDLGQRAAGRNRAILQKVNDYLDPVTIDYERDVLPLTPAGHPTERHLVTAYIRAAESSMPDPAGFWAAKLGVPPGEMAAIMADSPRLQTLIRSKLMKRGGVGYVQPESGMFPTLDAFHELVLTCGALPCAAWLDGTTETEQSIEEWLAFLIDCGVVAINIIPDRNWNLEDPQARSLKVANLHRVVELAGELDLILHIGTEMNSFEQKVVDDLQVPELAPLRESFLEGAHVIYGHTAMQRALSLGYQSAWARIHLPGRRERNRFYARVGACLAPGKPGLDQLRRLDPEGPPANVLSALSA